MNPETTLEAPNFLEDYLDRQPVQIGGYLILPWGDDNCYPNRIMQVCISNGLVSQIMNKHFELLWGKGPQLYKTEFASGRRYKQWISNKEVESWLESWIYKDYLEKITVEYLLLNACVTKFHVIGSAVEKLEFISCDGARLQWAGLNIPATSMIIGDFVNYTISGYDRFAIMDPENPLAQKESICFEALYQAGVEFYPRSPIHSSLPWIHAGAKTARQINAFNGNSISPKYHFEVPDTYWENYRIKLKSECHAKGISFNENMLKAVMDETFEEVSNALSGIHNVGKFLVTDIIYDERSGKYQGWTVTPLETKNGDYLNAQLKIAHETQFNVVSGMGMHPALTGMRKSGGLSTGSEFLYAAEIYKQVQVEFAERKIMNSINAAIAINFKDIKAKLGFNRDNI